MELGPLQEQWLKALESGEFKQIHGALKKKDGYCCLGVACELSKVSGWDDNLCYDGSHAYMPTRVVEKLGFRSRFGTVLDTCFDKIGSAFSHAGYLGRTRHGLGEYNDEGATFKQIASVVRQHPEVFFSQTA